MIDRTHQSLTLADVNDTHQFEVQQVLSGNLDVGHLEDLGFLPGTRVCRVGQAPFGDPIIFDVRGTRFALRRVDAAQVHVKPVDDAVISVAESSPEAAADCVA